MLEGGNDLAPAFDQVVEVFLGLTDQVLIDGLSVQVNCISQRLLELGAIKVHKENRFDWEMVSDLILNTLELLNRVSVLLDGILLISLVLEHSPDTSFVSHVLELTQLFGGLPMSSVVLHSRCNGIDTNKNLLNLRLDLLVGGDSLLIGVSLFHRIKFEAIFPPVVLFLLGHVLVVVVCLNVLLLEGSGGVTTRLVNHVDLLLDLSDDLLSLLSEDLLDSLDDTSDLDDLPHELLELNLKNLMGWLIDDDPLVSLTKDSVDGEDGNKRLRVLRLVSKNVLTEGDQVGLNSLLKSLV